MTIDNLKIWLDSDETGYREIPGETFDVTIRREQGLYEVCLRPDKETLDNQLLFIGDWKNTVRFLHNANMCTQWEVDI